MAHYAYKACMYDIDYEKYLQLVKKFEQEVNRECDRDSNYDGDNWYIAAMWIEELRERLKIALDALENVELALDEMREYPITQDLVIDAIFKLKET